MPFGPWPGQVLQPTFKTPPLFTGLFVHNQVATVAARQLMPAQADGGANANNAAFAQTRQTSRNTDLSINVGTNGSTGITTFTVMKNGVATALTRTVAAGATGQFNASSNALTWNGGDTFGIQVTNTTGGGTALIANVNLSAN